MKKGRRNKIISGRPNRRGFKFLSFLALALAVAGVVAAAAAGAFTRGAAARAAQDEASGQQDQRRGAEADTGRSSSTRCPARPPSGR